MIHNNGIAHFENFLPDSQREKLNIEIDKISKEILINGNSKASVWINHNQFEVINPIVNIDSINTLDIAFNIFKKLKEITSISYTLTSLRIFDEKKNIYPVNWHTDSAQNHIRGLLYLHGGDEDNGNLSYILESHKERHDGETHNIDINKLNLQSKVYKCESKPGDLILLDINGYHKKNTVKNHRRIIFFEFQEQKSSVKSKTKIIFDNSKIKKEMLQEPDFLFYNSDKVKLINPVYYDHLILHTPLKVFKYYLVSFIKLQIKKVLRKFNIK
jgi:hypothetical protein